jgi:hypothetical protein
MRGCLQTKSKRGNRPVVLGMSALPRPNRPQWDQIKRGHGLPVPMQNFFSVSAWGENGVNCFNRPALFKKLQWAVHPCSVRSSSTVCGPTKCSLCSLGSHKIQKECQSRSSLPCGGTVMQPAELRKATAEIRSRNQLLQVGNAHLLNLLTESSVNTEQLAIESKPDKPSEN